MTALGNSAVLNQPGPVHRSRGPEPRSTSTGQILPVAVDEAVKRELNDVVGDAIGVLVAAFGGASLD